MTDTAPKAVCKVLVGRTALQAYVTVMKCFIPILKAAVLPLVLLLALIAMYALAVILGGIIAGILLITMVVFQYVPLTFFGVAVSRIVLLGPDAGAPAFVAKWRLRHWRFFGFLLMFSLLLAVWATLFIIIGTAVTESDPRMGDTRAIWVVLAMAVTSIGFPYVFLRLCFVFPSAAVDEIYPLRDYWRLSTGQGVRLFVVLVLTSLPVLAIHSIAVVLLVTLAWTGVMFSPRISEWSSVGNIAAQCLMLLVAGAIGYLWVVAVLSPISMAFRRCTGWMPMSSQAETPSGNDHIARS